MKVSEFFRDSGPPPVDSLISSKGRKGVATEPPDAPNNRASGVNLYQYAGNNPASYTDPFGLKVCYEGTAEDVQSLKTGTEDATGTRITLDDSNCVESFEATGAEGFEEIQERFGAQVASRTTFTVQYYDDQYYSSYDPQTATARIHPGDVGSSYLAPRRITGCWLPSPSGRFTLGALVAHELIGHGHGQLAGVPHGTAEAIRVENLYHAARGQPRRCQ